MTNQSIPPQGRPAKGKLLHLLSAVALATPASAAITLVDTDFFTNNAAAATSHTVTAEQRPNKGKSDSQQGT